jgi:hypothetical protein
MSFDIFVLYVSFFVLPPLTQIVPIGIVFNLLSYFCLVLLLESTVASHTRKLHLPHTWWKKTSPPVKIWSSSKHLGKMFFQVQSNLICTYFLYSQDRNSQCFKCKWAIWKLRCLLELFCSDHCWFLSLCFLHANFFF